MEVIQRAVDIAVRDLRWCYRDKGIVSGSRNVYWSWDSFFAGLGATRIGDSDEVRRNLDLYFSLQREDGAIPKRIANPWYWTKYIGFPIREDDNSRRPTFSNSYFTAESLAQNPTFVIAVHDYVTKTNDQAYFKKHKKDLERLFEYLAKHRDEHGLLKEGLGGGWAESVLKRGAIAFTNMCYARSLQCMTELTGEAHWLEHYQVVTEEINRRLWSDEDGGYYSDWYDSHRHHHFATDGNLLAIWWDIASRDQAEKILDKITELDLESDVPIKLAYDPYAFWRIFIFNRLGGMKNYHVGFSWTWLGCADVMARLKLGRTEEAQFMLKRIAKVIVRDGTVHETYDKGKAVQTMFYKSENPWAWGAGLFLCAVAESGLVSMPEELLP